MLLYKVQNLHSRNVEVHKVKKEAKKNLSKWLNIEKSIVVQKFRVNWIRHGDDNIEFF